MVNCTVFRWVTFHRSLPKKKGGFSRNKLVKYIHFAEIWRCFFLVRLSGGTSHFNALMFRGRLHWIRQKAGIVHGPWGDPHELMGHVQKPRHRKCMTQRVDGLIEKSDSAVYPGENQKKQHLQRLNNRDTISRWYAKQWLSWGALSMDITPWTLAMYPSLKTNGE